MTPMPGMLKSVDVEVEQKVSYLKMCTCVGGGGSAKQTGFACHFDATLCRPIEFSIKFHTFKSGWSIVYIERSQVIISKKYCISFSKD